MQTGLFHLGRNRALQSGTTEPRSEDILALKDHARAMAKQTYRDKYDPVQNVHDAMHETEYRRDLAQREEAEKGNNTPPQISATRKSNLLGHPRLARSLALIRRSLRRLSSQLHSRSRPHCMTAFSSQSATIY
jgi:hypothetical protein